MRNFENTYRSNPSTGETPNKKSKYTLLVGIFLQAFSLFFLFSVFGYFFSYKTDQTIIEFIGKIKFSEAPALFSNWFGVFGAYIGYYFVYRWFGFFSFILSIPIYFLGRQLTSRKKFKLLKIVKITSLSMLFCFLTSTSVAYFIIKNKSLHETTFTSFVGGFGVIFAQILDGFFGLGTVILLFTSLIFMLTYLFSVELLFKVIDEVYLLFSITNMKNFFRKLFPIKDKSILDSKRSYEKDSSFIFYNENSQKDETKLVEEAINDISYENSSLLQNEASNKDLEKNIQKINNISSPSKEYHFPSGSLLKDRIASGNSVSNSEIEYNKAKIVETLKNFNIGISNITATVGPTITLYEIIPNAGVKVSRIKNLEDDIALSLSALGIRIIAPIPGKGTVGIEVPNKITQIVSLKPIIFSDKFINANMALPIIIGKGIDNEAYIKDLATMPHLLIAGATGQGKSVGLNVILTSLIFKKRPDELKFVLIDPKKVELSLYEKLRKHFLVNVSNMHDTIITDTKKVIFALKNLCKEMDYRYELLKDAGVRNIVEYNQKLKEGRLNYNNGHKFLPYIVLVIDEFADLMMVAGKEVELPIARLAQLARAIGIHLIIATQRPSVNVITGIIKANFPARISFKVSSKVDSRTILDMSGAEQLIGRGDLLLSLNSDVVRLQCPLLETDEIENICNYIDHQEEYHSEYNLTELSEEGNFDEAESTFTKNDLSDKDSMFDEAAQLIVANQLGSTSLLQRKLQIGYARAGRIMDQLEQVGIVGPADGSKPRELYIKDMLTLDEILKNV